MKELVFIQNNDVLTESLTVAELFGKRHDLVLRDIRKTISSLGELVKNGEVKDLGIDMSSLKFEETHYEHRQNKQNYPMYLLNFDAFMLVTMSYTTKSAMLIKIKYMKQFNEMKERLSTPRVLTTKEQITASMKLSIEANEELEEHDKRIKNLEDNMRISGLQEFQINQLGKRKVLKSLGGYKSPAYQEMSSKVFARFWRDFKQHFTLPRYSELPKKKYDEAIDFINIWQPDTSTRLEIEAINRQQVLKGVI